jgi:hypothetical protein
MSNAKMLLAIVVMVVVAKALFPNIGTAAAGQVSSLGSAVTGATASSPGGIAAHIRHCESGGNYRAQNGTTTASGAYQFVNGTWRGVTHLPPPARIYPPAVQDRAFVKLWAGGAGAHNWDASRHCWGRYWTG